MIKKVQFKCLFATIGMFLTAQLNAQTFSNTSAITIVDEAPASSYPSTINVSGTTGSITNVSVKINGLTHAYISDVSIILQAPNGNSLLLQALCADGASASNLTYTISDAGATQFSSTAIWANNGTYKPTGYSWDVFTSPAPPTPPGVGTYSTPGPFGSFGTNATMASTFNGISPNGQWKLFIQDFAAGDGGVISGGWSLNVTTNTALPVTFNSINANCINNKINLSWMYNDEFNLDHFEVMESNDGEHFEVIESILPLGKNKLHLYSKENNKGELNTNFYKVKVVDIDKKESFSEVVAVKCIGNTSLLVYPTIVENLITINSEIDEIKSVEIYNNVGMLVYAQKNIDLKMLLLDVNKLNLTTGIYNLRVLRDENSDIFKIIKN